MLTHSEGKPFSCDVCGKKFRTESYVKVNDKGAQTTTYIVILFCLTDPQTGSLCERTKHRDHQEKCNHASGPIGGDSFERRGDLKQRRSRGYRWRHRGRWSLGDRQQRRVEHRGNRERDGEQRRNDDEPRKQRRTPADSRTRVLPWPRERRDDERKLPHLPCGLDIISVGREIHCRIGWSFELYMDDLNWPGFHLLSVQS